MTYSFLEPVPIVKGVDYHADPVGVLEIAERLGVMDRSVHKMIQRGRLPAPDYDQINGSRAWEWRTVLWWAGETKRLSNDDLRSQYRSMFRREPPVARAAPRGAVVRPDPTPDLPTVPAP